MHLFEQKAEADFNRSTVTVRALVRSGNRRRTVRKRLCYPYPHLILMSERGAIRHPANEPMHLNEFATPRLVGAPTATDGMTPFIFEGAAPRCRATALLRPSGRRNTLVSLNDGGTLELCGDLVNLRAAGCVSGSPQVRSTPARSSMTCRDLTGRVAAFDDAVRTHA